MRKKHFIIVLLLVFFVFLFIKVTHAQGVVTTEKAQSILGQRFISCKEAGIEEVPILFNENKLMEDSTSWLFPINLNNEFKYILIKTNYFTSNIKQDEVNMFSELEMRRILVFVNRLRKSFPFLKNEFKYDGYVFQSKDMDPDQSKRSLKFGIPLNLCFFYHEGNICTLSLPQNASKVLVNSDSYVYVYKNKQGESASGGGGSYNENCFYEKNTVEKCLQVMTLVSIK
jgi:hypothetical protein